jgi:hypothetical protein
MLVKKGRDKKEAKEVVTFLNKTTKEKKTLL